MDTGLVVRVLVLDGNRASGLDRITDVVVEATFEGRDALLGEHGYIVSQHGLDLAATATLAEFDAVVIGNNEFVGPHKAVRIASDLRSRTLIVWNRLTPGDEVEYRAMGFQHFGQRYSDEGGCPLGVKEFIRQVAAEIYGG